MELKVNEMTPVSNVEPAVKTDTNDGAFKFTPLGKPSFRNG